MIKLAPSILSADFGRLAEQLREIETGGAHLIHVDVMDGHFVPNITIGPVVLKAIRKSTGLPLDVHLMIANPEKYIDAFITAGADIVTVHMETVTDPANEISLIKKRGARAGVAINPPTPVDVIQGILPDLDMVTVMSVNPGFGGQTFIPESIDKIVAVRRLIDARGLAVELEVDGGVTGTNAEAVIDAGADILVAGAAVFGGGDIEGEIARFLAIMAVAK